MKFTSSRKREIKTVSWDVTKIGKGKIKKWEQRRELEMKSLIGIGFKPGGESAYERGRRCPEHPK